MKILSGNYLGLLNGKLVFILGKINIQNFCINASPSPGASFEKVYLTFADFTVLYSTLLLGYLLFLKSHKSVQIWNDFILYFFCIIIP